MISRTFQSVVGVLWFLLPVWANVTNVQLVGLTPQQAVVSFRVPNTAQCTAVVYSDAALTVKANDTNEALFAGSESCARHIFDGTTVTAVLGLRTSQKAINGTLQSRSLETSAQYWLKITDTSTSQSTVVPFKTRTIPWGNTFPDWPQYNSAGTGNIAYPDIDWSDAGNNAKYIDPMTGVQLRRTPRPRYYVTGLNGNSSFTPVAFDQAFDPNSKWTGAQNATVNSATGPFAAYSGTTQDPLMLTAPIYYSNGALFSQYDQDQGSLMDLQVKVSGYSDPTGVTVPDDQAIYVCLAVSFSFNNPICTSPEQKISLPLNTATTVVFPSSTSFPQWQFGQWNIGRFLTMDETASMWGNQATLTGTSLSLGGAEYVPFIAAPGMKIKIGANWYTIASVTGSKTLTTVESGTESGQWHLGNIVVRIRKATTAANTLHLNATFVPVWIQNPPMGSNGLAEKCSRNTVSVGYDASGTPYPNGATKTGRLCRFGVTNNSRNMIFLLLDDGEMRPLSPFQGGKVVQAPPAFSLSDPLLWYSSDVDNSDPSCSSYGTIYEVRYDAATCKYAAYTGNGAPECLTYTNRMSCKQNTAIQQQIQASVQKDPIWDPALSLNWNFTHISGNYGIFNLQPSAQDNVCWVAIFDLRTMTLVKTLNSFSAPGMRFGGCHSNGLDLNYQGDYASIGFSLLRARNGTGFLSGPFALDTGKNGVFAVSFDGGQTWDSTSTAINPGTLIDTATAAGKCGTPAKWVVGTKCVDLTRAAGTCGANPYGVTGAQCIKIRTHSDRVCNVATVAGSTELKHSGWVCPWNSNYSSPPQAALQPGDYVAQGINNSTAPFWKLPAGNQEVDGKTEKLRILSKTALGNGDFEFELQRWSTCDNPTSDYTSGAVQYYDHLYYGSGEATYADGWTLIATPTGACSISSSWTNLGDPSSAWIPDNTAVTADHNSIGPGPDAGSFFQVGSGAVKKGTVPDMFGKMATSALGFNQASSRFEGIDQSNGVTESYPSDTQWTATSAAERAAVFNVRHYNPNSGFFNPEDTQVLYQQTAPVLVTGQTNTYRYTPLWGVGDSKIRRPHVATTRGIFRDVSGPSCVVNDSTPGTYGVVYKAGECAQGSQPGEVVVSVPANADRTWGCIIQTHRTYAPCVMAWHSFGAWTLQYDKTRYDAFGGRMRRLTWGFAWPLAQYIFSAAHISPDAQWGFVRFWPVGNVRLDPIAFKIPPMPAEDHVDRSRFIRKPVQVAAGQAYARVRFGYAEYGTPGTNYYCTERQEDCVTDVAVKPFAFTGSDTLTPAACSSGCTIPVPAISGRVLYYRVERSSNGTTWDSGPIQTMVVE